MGAAVHPGPVARGQKFIMYFLFFMHFLAFCDGFYQCHIPFKKMMPVQWAGWQTLQLRTLTADGLFCSTYRFNQNKPSGA